MLSPSPKSESLSRRNIALIVATICVTALVAPQIFNAVSRDKPEARNALAVDSVLEDRGAFQSGNYIIPFGFGAPVAVPSCQSLSPASSSLYSCVNGTTVKQITFSKNGCQQGSETGEQLFTNGKAGAVVDCSKNKSPFVQSAIIDPSISCPAKQPPLSKIKSSERWATGLCFNNFGPPGFRFGCARNKLITDQFESTSCTGLFYRTKTRRCYSTSSLTKTFKCSRGEGRTRPPRFPRPLVARQSSGSCGSAGDPKIMFSLNKCYGNNFPELKVPVIHSCRRRGRLHVESMFSSGDCTNSLVSEAIFPTGVCVNGMYKEHCVATRRQMRNRPPRIPKNEAIVGKLYETSACSGQGIKIRIKKDTEFSFGFDKIKLTCANGKVKETLNGQSSVEFSIGQCQPLTAANRIGRNSAGLLFGKYVQFSRCP